MYFLKSGYYSLSNDISFVGCSIPRSSLLVNFSFVMFPKAFFCRLSVIVHRLLFQVSVLVLAHTRELAFQISQDYERFSKYMNNVKIAVFFGGMPIKKDEEVLKKNCPHIVVGTPGRILALIKSKALGLKNVKHFILDECDKMLCELGKLYILDQFIKYLTDLIM